MLLFCGGIREQYIHPYKYEQMAARPTELAQVLAPRTSQFRRSKTQALKNLDPRINPDKPPRNFRDAMKALDKWSRLKAIRHKKVPIAPNVVLKPGDTPDLPDSRKQKFYSSFVAKLQFAATWVRFDIAFAVSQLARFCASAGSSHWSALHHLMEYLAGTPSFKIT